MKNNHWSKMLTALLLALAMLGGSLLGALAEETAPAEEAAEAAVVADLTEEVEEEPVLLASVNGDEIWSNNADMRELIDYYTSMYASYGYDTEAADFQAYVNASGLRWAVESALYEQKKNELGTPEMTEEQRAELEEAAKADWEDAVEYFLSYMGGLTDESTEEETAEARLNVLAYLESAFGYTEESYVAEYVEGMKPSTMRENVRKAVLGEIEATDEEIVNHFNELVEQDKASYEENATLYLYYLQNNSSEFMYRPEGLRAVTHILLDVDTELLNNYNTLVARLEEQQEAETADESTETASEIEESTEENPETAEEPQEPVTQEQVDAAKQAILDSVQATVDEIMAKLAAGTSFADLIAEYGTDPGMTMDPYMSEGYMIHESIPMGYDQAFSDAAVALKQVGDVSEPIVSSFGVHLIYYFKDIPAGAVELTDAIRANLAEEIVNEKESLAVTEMVEGWMNEAEIIYTNEGQAILDEAEAANDESVETTEATEEALADGNE